MGLLARLVPEGRKALAKSKRTRVSQEGTRASKRAGKHLTSSAWLSGVKARLGA
jgi:hypothetical protein